MRKKDNAQASAPKSKSGRAASARPAADGRVSQAALLGAMAGDSLRQEVDSLLSALPPLGTGHGYVFKPPPDLSRAEVRERLSGVAAAAFFRLVEIWGVADGEARQLLGGISNGAYYALKANAALERHGGARMELRGKAALEQDKLTRISLLIGIFRSLNLLYSPALADSWVKLENVNPVFNGAAPLDYMRRGGVPAMMRVRQLLQAREEG